MLTPVFPIVLPIVLGSTVCAHRHLVIIFIYLTMRLVALLYHRLAFMWYLVSVGVIINSNTWLISELISLIVFSVKVELHLLFCTLISR